MGDFWSWAYSNPLINVDRGVLAEFLVGHALGVVDGVREPWDPYDLVYSGHPIEVKSSSYIQAWSHEGHLTTPTFGVEATGAWVYDSEGQYVYDPQHRRRASIYVFCLYAETDLNKANVLDVPAWEFYVLPTGRIDVELGAQKRVGLGTLRRMIDPVSYPALKKRVDEALSTLQ
jgi:hypothetical protein